MLSDAVGPDAQVKVQTLVQAPQWPTYLLVSIHAQRLISGHPQSTRHSFELLLELGLLQHCAVMPGPPVWSVAHTRTVRQRHDLEFEAVLALLPIERFEIKHVDILAS